MNSELHQEAGWLIDGILPRVGVAAIVGHGGIPLVLGIDIACAIDPTKVDPTWGGHDVLLGGRAIGCRIGSSIWHTGARVDDPPPPVLRSTSLDDIAAFADALLDIGNVRVVSVDGLETLTASPFLGAEALRALYLLAWRARTCVVFCHETMPKVANPSVDDVALDVPLGFARKADAVLCATAPTGDKPGEILVLRKGESERLLRFTTDSATFDGMPLPHAMVDDLWEVEASARDAA